MSKEALEHLEALAKPVGALGLLEDWAARLRDLFHPENSFVSNPSLAIFCADHGVAHCQNVSQFPATLTPLIAFQLVKGRGGASVIAPSVGVGPLYQRVVDVGMIIPHHPNTEIGSVALVPGPPVRPGTLDFTEGPAMNVQECVVAESIGARTIRDLHNAGSNCIALGEVGIGNTAVSSALLSAFTGELPIATCGAGTGLSADGIVRKAEIVERALLKHALVVADVSKSPRAVLAALGGLEIAAIVGAIHEANRRSVAVIIDGFICSVGALAALRIDSSCARCMFLATASPERGHQICVKEIAKYIWPATGRPEYSASPVPLNMGLRLGEGTGALLCIPILRAAGGIYNDMVTLDEAVKDCVSCGMEV